MAHRGPFRCDCGELHDEYEESNDLLPFVDTQKVTCLNEQAPESCKSVFKPFTQRQTVVSPLRSAEDDPELMLYIPFTASVRLTSFIVIGGPGGSPPSHVRAFINREGIDFSDAADLVPVQEWDLAQDDTGVLEYPTQRSKFQNVTSLALHFTENHERPEEVPTSIRYVGLKGVGTNMKRGIVNAVYEVRPVPEANAAKDEVGGPSRLGM